jgi:hypothetical protein
MKSNSAAILMAILCSILVSHPLISEDQDRSNAAKSVTIAELRDHLYYLASDELGGRMPGQEGYDIAVTYAVTQFRQAGLKPIITDLKGRNVFRQEVKLVTLRQGEKNRIFVIRDGEEKEFAHGSDFFLFRPGRDYTKDYQPLEIVYAGYGIHEPEHGYDSFEGLDLEGKAVLILNGAPLKDGKPLLPNIIHRKYASIMGAQQKYLPVRERGAAAFILLPDAQMIMGWKMIKAMLEQNAMIQLARDAGEQEESAMNPLVPMMIFNESICEEIFSGLDNNPLEGGESVEGFDIEKLQIKPIIDMQEEPFPTHNVVAMVEGTDPVLKEEFITVGAHLDHEGIIEGQVFNGADDNASGCAAVLEIAEAVAMNPPRRSVIFVLYSAEEMGLFGSKYFIGNPPVPAESILLNINLDMVGRDSEDAPGQVQVVGSQERSRELKQLIISTNQDTENLELDFSTDESDPENHFVRSDHYPFHLKGIPAFTLGTGEHKDYHTPNDDAEKIDYTKLNRISVFCYELIQVIGNREERVKID